MDAINESFNEYVEEFKKLNTMEKANELNDSIKELLTFVDLLATKQGINLNYLTSGEINDLYKENTLIDDYLEAMLVYIENIKNNLSQIIEKGSLNN